MEHGLLIEDDKKGANWAPFRITKLYFNNSISSVRN